MYKVVLERIANRCRDCYHQMARKLVNTTDVLAFEGLKMAHMLKNNHLAQLIADAAWGQLVTIGSCHQATDTSTSAGLPSCTALIPCWRAGMISAACPGRATPCSAWRWGAGAAPQGRVKFLSAAHPDTSPAHIRDTLYHVRAPVVARSRGIAVLRPGSRGTPR